MPYQIEWTEASKSDYEKLDNSQLVFVDKALTRIIKLGMSAGQPLSGELIGCNKLKNRKMGLRVVFRQSAKGIEIIQIVAIGARADRFVYDIASGRVQKL